MPALAELLSCINTSAFIARLCEAVTIPSISESSKEDRIGVRTLRRAARGEERWVGHRAVHSHRGEGRGGGAGRQGASDRLAWGCCSGIMSTRKRCRLIL
ncbi:hypothetical protein B0H13DRAFT_1024286 [Mycena leptocephala]|nr:hypothetical protein B0H13DRAFT_1024286 [Mycena leptocephala]